MTVSKLGKPSVINMFWRLYQRLKQKKFSYIYYKLHVIYLENQEYSASTTPRHIDKYSKL